MMGYALSKLVASKRMPGSIPARRRPIAKALLRVLADYAPDKPPFLAWPTTAALATAVEVSERSARQPLQDLALCRLIIEKQAARQHYTRVWELSESAIQALCPTTSGRKFRSPLEDRTGRKVQAPLNRQGGSFSIPGGRETSADQVIRSDQVEIDDRIEVWPIGEHRGKPLADLPDQYLDWALGPDSKIRSPRLRAALRQEFDRRAKAERDRNDRELRSYAAQDEARRKRRESVSTPESARAHIARINEQLAAIRGKKENVS